MSGTSEEENGFEDEEPRARNGCSTCCYPSTSSCCCQTSREESVVFNVCKSTCAFLVTHVGLICLVTCYCLVGAFTFEMLEKKHELDVKKQIATMRDEVTDSVWDFKINSPVLDEDKFIANVTERLKQFEHQLIKAMRKDGWNGDEDEENRQWTFMGALFYSIVCITTIGYGDQTPKTQEGKFVTVAYSLIGIPLMVLCLSNTGGAMARSFRFIYWRLCCSACVSASAAASRGHNHPRYASTSQRVSHTATLLQKHPVTTIVQHPSLPSLTPISSRRSAVIRSSPRFATERPSGQNTPVLRAKNFRHGGSDSHRRALSVRSRASDGKSRRYKRGRMNRARSVELGEAKLNLEDAGNNVELIKELMARRKDETDETENSKEKDDPPNAVINDEGLDVDNQSLGSGKESRFERSKETRTSHRSNKSDKTLSLHLPLDVNKMSSGDSSQSTPTKQLQLRRVLSTMPEDNPADELITLTMNDLEFEELVRKKPVPLLVCAILVVAYVLLGASVFKRWEGWNYWDSAYFCVISLTTIGFGDFVPKANKAVEAEVSIAISSVYLLFGMSLLFMTFNLVQEQVVSKLKRLAFIFGLIKAEELAEQN